MKGKLLNFIFIFILSIGAVHAKSPRLIVEQLLTPSFEVINGGVIAIDNEGFLNFYHADGKLIQIEKIVEQRSFIEVTTYGINRSYDPQISVIADGEVIHLFYYNFISDLLMQAKISNETVSIKSIASSALNPSAALCGSAICVSFYDKNEMLIKLAKIDDQVEISQVTANGASPIQKLSFNTHLQLAYYDQDQKIGRLLTLEEGLWTEEIITDTYKNFGLNPQFATSANGEQVLIFSSIISDGLYVFVNKDGKWREDRIDPSVNSSLEIGDEKGVIISKLDSDLIKFTNETNGLWSKSLIHQSSALVEDYRYEDYVYYSLSSDEGFEIFKLTPDSEVNSGSENNNTQEQINTSKDSDGDGLSDEEEIKLGTNRLLADTDSDGVSDSQEILDGSNPLDRGSFVSTLPSRVCSEWNGFLGGMYNILELQNRGGERLPITLELYSQSGLLESRTNAQINAFGQTDILVHDLPGYQLDRVGQICISYDGNLDGRMVYYRQNEASYDFAISFDLDSGLSGTQSVSINTANPDFTKSNVSVANWLQITNQSSKPQSGKIYIYSLTGEELEMVDITVSSNARVDFPLHSYGQSFLGMAKWVPTNADARFLVRNVRYIYSDANFTGNIITAYQVPAKVGTFSNVTAAIFKKNSHSSSILEVVNTGTQTASVEVDIHSKNGSLIKQFSYSLLKNSSHHLILDEVIDAGGVSASIKTKGGELVSSAMHYVRDESSSLEYAYQIPALKTLGSVIAGSYNTFIDQLSMLTLVNQTDTKTTLDIDVRNLTGGSIASFQIDLEARGSETLNINDIAGNDMYGSIYIHSSSSGEAQAWVKRENASQYILPTIFRQ